MGHWLTAEPVVLPERYCTGSMDPARGVISRVSRWAFDRGSRDPECRDQDT